MSMVQFTRTEIRWLIGIVDNIINANKAYVEGIDDNSLVRIVKLQTDNLLSVKQRLQHINRDKMIKRVEITK